MWNKTLLSRPDWQFKDILFIGHSAGAVEVLNMLMVLSAGLKVKTAVLVSPVRVQKHMIALSELIHQDLDFDKITRNAERFIIVHSQDDPVAPVADAKYYAEKLGAKLIVLPSGGHFSILRSLRFWRFPELVRILELEKVL